MTGPDRVERSDVVVVGAGAAGLRVALELATEAPALAVTVLSRGEPLSSGASRLAQGGVAAALGADDSPAHHAADTVRVGAGLCAQGAVAVLTRGAPGEIERLVGLGAAFDRVPSGGLALGREAGHSRHRIVHARGDSSGAEVVRTLVAALAGTDRARVVVGATARRVVTAAGQVVGVLASTDDGGTVLHAAPRVVLATGGAGQLWARTTNPPEATGAGLALAAAAGARLADLEFVQFHPTALDCGIDPLPLVTEALRGEGAVLVDETGRRFLLGVHPDAELAPRDVVARAVAAELAAGRRVHLDATEAVGAAFPERFPRVWAACVAAGVDPRREPIPVTPAAHYLMGGVDVDTAGRTTVAGLWAVGETARTGVHGANRLASNSLAEALVFGRRVAASVAEADLRLPARLPAVAPLVLPPAELEAEVVRDLREVMWRHAGLVRDEAGLSEADRSLDVLAERLGRVEGTAAAMLAVARLVVSAAAARPHSVGAHLRADDAAVRVA